MEETKSVTPDIATTPPATVIPPEPEPPLKPKPKRVLTEAQRLAFARGREKRLANLERKRMEKEEAKLLEGAPLPDLTPTSEPLAVLPDSKVEVESPEEIPASEEDITKKVISKILDDYDLVRKDTPHPGESIPPKPKLTPRTRTVKMTEPEPRAPAFVGTTQPVWL